MKNNNAIMIPTKILLVLFFIICISVLVYAWLITQNVECDPEDNVELTGMLKGFTKNETYWNVKLGDGTYLFGVFDEDYMQSMIGYDIRIKCCFRHDTSFQIGHYDMISAYINEVKI